LVDVVIEAGGSQRSDRPTGRQKGRAAYFLISWSRQAMSDLVQTVGALLVNSDSQVLLGLRAKWKEVLPGHWDVIGGRVESGETLDQALIREVLEEIGVRPKSFQLLATFHERNPHSYGNALHHVYGVTNWEGGTPVNKSNEHTEIRWFGAKELSALSNLADCSYLWLAQLAISLKTGFRTQPA
jgi:mutator protein MutT